MDALLLPPLQKEVQISDVFNKKVSYSFNERIKEEGIKMLGSLQDEKLKICFFDPQYRGVLDKLRYGNEGARQVGRAHLPQMTESVIELFIVQIARVLCPCGYLFLWVDKFHLMNNFQIWCKNTPLQVVDMITWDKMKMGMGYRTRRQCEYLVILQKKPIKSKGTWENKSIRDIWSEKVDSGVHPHGKPYDLQKILIESVSEEGDIVGDFAAGSFRVLDACKATHRTFIGCDVC